MLFIRYRTSRAYAHDVALSIYVKVRTIPVKDLSDLCEGYFYTFQALTGIYRLLTQ
jgi:hypothetical protein